MPTYQTRQGRTRAIIRVAGHQTMSKTFASMKLARAWAIKTEAEMLEGDHVAASKMTVRQLFEKYRDEVASDRWSIIRIDQLLRDGGFAELPANSCHDGLAAWLERRRKEVKPNTVRREVSMMGSVFKHAIKRWKLKCKEGRSPTHNLDRPDKGKDRKRRVKPEELAKLWVFFGAGAPRYRKQYVPFMFEFACETGMRLGELCKLRWDEVHLEERWVSVLQTKNGDDRHAVLTPRAVELLELLPRTGEMVFPVNRGSVGTEFHKACRELKIVDLHFHDSRHEATSRLCKLLSVMELAAVIGHRDLRSLMVYYNPTAEELAVKVGQGIAASMQPRPQQTTSVGSSAG